jgi:2-oxoglutarate dehydrogenase E1 component
MFGFNSGYVEDLYAQYRQNPESVSASWREFFADFDPGPTYSTSIGAEASDSETKARMLAPEPEGSGGATEAPAATPTSGDGAPSSAPRSSAPSAPTPPAPAPRPSGANGAPAGGGADGGELPARLAAPEVTLPEGAETGAIKGVGARIVENMEASLTIPTATSVREIAVKLLSENRRLINQHQKRVGGDKVTFTHLIAYAIVRAMEAVPSMKAAFREHDGQPERIDPSTTSFGLAIDIEKRGKRQLLVPNIKQAESLSFAEFLGAYNDVVKRALGGKLQLDDFAGTTATLTNPGGIGTQMSVPRLMPGQSVIVAVGGIGYPPEYAGMDPGELSRLGLSPVMTMTSTYDHRVIQGAESGEFLNVIADLLQGGRGFYEEVFHSLGLHTPPFRGKADSTPALGKAALGSGAKASKVEKQARVYELIRAYRVRGHLLADTNPLGYEPRNHTELDPASYGLTVWDLDRTFFTGGMAGVTGGGLAGNHTMTLRDILDTLWDTYTGHVGSEFMHLSSPEEKRWLIERIEPQQFREPIDTARKKRIFEKLNEAEALEQFIHTKYIGHKRFSLEGAETMIPLLDAVISDAADQETDEVVIGMAHRGRLNVLTNILGKPYDRVFSEFEGTVDPDAVHGSGDVKYHLGQTGTHTSPNGSKTQLTLASNPSHLEAVNPVVEGMARAKQQRIVEAHPDASEKRLRDKVLPILVHGDAAFAGQGVVAETLNLSQLEGYRTGGTVHLVVNNQIGFTTLPMHSRSSAYATDIARMIQAPIFHVNGDDPEAAVRVARLALDYRNVFNKDVVIDLVCYRKYGHNEGDEPSYTQPLMYADIGAHRSVRKLYLELLLRRGELTPEQAEAILDDFKDKLDSAFEETKELAERHKDRQPVAVPIETEDAAVATAADRDQLTRVMEALVTMPDDLQVHKKLARLVVDRRRKQFEEGTIDWAFAESLAFGTLLLEGTPVRLSGQDSGRGTFSQRHAILYDQEDGHRYLPLNHLAPGGPGDGQARFQVYDSLLSEYAALGFEYGYSVADPSALVLWEAQFGDFVNGAQIMIDQFITAAEAKWGQTSSLVMLLPHGYEGQGPEHSSGRLERFLQACAEDNLIVANFSTPANYFHALRRQVKRADKKPLVVMTPKSLLRLPEAVTSVEELADGAYRPFIASEGTPEADRLVICSGKVVYDVLKAREALERPSSVAVARLEQFYPFPEDAVREELARFEGKPVVWLQEEPENMGAWTFVRPRFDTLLEELHGDCSHRIRYAGRAAAASPAAGSAKVHAAVQEQILRDALGIES